MTLIQTIKFIRGHPFNTGRQNRAILSFLVWQLKTRLSHGPFVHRFTNLAWLSIMKGMSGATGNIYCGLHEFHEMSFLLHFLRKDELFADIGANVGTYTVLAAAHIGARVIAAEPIPVSITGLKNNLAINKADEKVRLYEVAIGDSPGQIQLTNKLGAMNHVAVGVDANTTVEVPVITLDELLNGKIPILIKIDVEGYETAVINGGWQTLQNEALQAIIMELNGAGEKYGFDEEKLHQRMLAAGFSPYTYSPYKRELIPLPTHGHHNTIYLRHPQDAIRRVKSAEAFTVQGRTL